MQPCNNFTIPQRPPAAPRRHPAYDHKVRHNPSTVVVLAGQPGDGLLTAVSRPANVTLVRPEATASPGSVAGTPGDGIAVAAAALRRAARISSPYVLVAADPLAAVAAQWQAMWELTQVPRGTEAFELRAGAALAAWRASQFELPDYYLVLAPERAGGPHSDGAQPGGQERSEEHTSELQSRFDLVCRPLLEK